MSLASFINSKKIKPTVKAKVPLRIVEPVKDAEDKTGCCACPLLAHSDDYPETFTTDPEVARTTGRSLYRRNYERIKGILKEPHTVTVRNVSEPWEPVDILFVGESPDEADDQNGLPFTGPTGKLLKGVVKKLFAPEDRIGYAYVARCRGPQDSSPGKTVLQSCSPELSRELAARQPKVVVAVGSASLAYFTGRSGVLAVHGKLMRCVLPGWEHLKIIASFSPGYAIKADHEFPRFIEAIDFSKKVLDGDYEEKAGEGDYYVLTSAQDVVDLLASFRAAKDEVRVRFDTETGSSTPFQKVFPPLLCFSFTDVEGVGYTVPWDHVDSPWSPYRPKPTLDAVPADFAADKPPKGTNKAAKAERAKWEAYNADLRALELVRLEHAWEDHCHRVKKERPIVRKALRDFFADLSVKKSAQNIKFDLQHIRRALDVEVQGELRDTMGMHMILSDVRGTHGLEVLSFTYTGMGGYHYVLDHYIKTHPNCDPNKGGSYANIPAASGNPDRPRTSNDDQVDLFIYAAQDTDATARSENEMEADPEYADPDHPLRRVQAEVFFPILARTLADMEYAGVAVDLGIVSQMKDELTVKIDTTLDKIKKVPEVRQFIADQLANGKRGKRKADSFDFNPGSDPQVRQILFEYYNCPPIEATDSGFKTLVARLARLQKEGQDVDYDSVVRRAVKDKQWSFFSVKAGVLEEYRRGGVPLADLMLDFRENQKLLNTYVEPMFTRMGDDGRVHGSFHPGGAVTGRLASSDPNLQNIPIFAKRAFVSRFGREIGLILSADYSQIELRFASSIFAEPRMIKAYVDGADLHTLTAIAISGMTPQQYKALPDKEKKKWRVRAKRINFGIIYGIGPPGIVNTLRKDGVYIDIEEAKVLRDKFREAYPDLMAGMAALERATRETGQVEAFTGYTRRLPEVFNSDEQVVSRALRQAVANFPVQHGAGFTTLIVMCIIHRRLRAAGARSLVISTVHDSILVDTVADESMAVASMMKDVMENVTSLSDEVYPGLDWSWLKVPLVADFDIGASWGTAAEFNPYLIDADGPSKPDEPLFKWDGKEFKQFRNPENTEELWTLIGEKAAA